MIPQRVRLSGFLSYQDEQELDFGDADLWMLAGPNGSGKSSIFDAVTYALFGSHRGGSLHASELINKDAEKATVEFEFLRGDHRYVAYRTLQRTKSGTTRSTQQIWACKPDGGREPIEETDKKAGYEGWIERNIGMSFEVFIASVMLRQGDAERVLDAGPAGRHKVLAGVVDLERYERLHERAADECKRREGSAENLNLRHRDMPEVTPIELAEAEKAIEEADSKYQQARAELRRLDKLQSKVEQWQKLQDDLSRARQAWNHVRSLLADQAAIDKDLERLTELRDALPDVQTVIEQRGHIKKSEAQSVALENHQEQLTQKLGQVRDAIDQAKRTIKSLKASISTEDRRHQEVTSSLGKATKLLEKLDLYERQEGTLKGIRGELASLSHDAAGEMKKARDAHDEIAAADRALPVLARLHDQRKRLANARTDEQKASGARDAIQKEGEQLVAEVKRFQPTLDAAVKAREAADAEATKAQTVLEHARQRLADLSQLDGAKVCGTCGQKLTKTLLQEQKTQRKEDVNQAEAVAGLAEEAKKVAKQQDQQVKDQLTELEGKVQKARDEFKEQRALAKQAGHEVQRLNQECGQSWWEVSPPFQERVAAKQPVDWLGTTYPSEADIAELREKAGTLASVRQRCKDAETVLAKWNTLKGQETELQRQLESLQGELQDDPQKVRSNHARLEAEEKALDAGIVAKRGELDAALQEWERLTNERGEIDKQLVEIKAGLTSEQDKRQSCQQIIGRSLQQLPEAWRDEAERAGMGDLFRWQNERDELIQQQTDERAKQLHAARANQTLLGSHLDELEREEGNFPPEARQKPEDVACLLRTAQDESDKLDNACRQAKQRRDQLADQRQQREQLQKDCLVAEREFKHAQLLAKLLSREYLQLHLIRRAERQVVLYANAILDRLSGGQLFLRLVGAADGEGTGEKALQLEAINHATAERPINVAFLSGSQKFRVAVSLALGLGQYASKQHRPIESVIIDEGFGCLDKEGRQAMIQELHNLRGHLRCILVVSHQEEFADAFDDGYRFELVNGSTKVTRIQR